MHEFQLQKGEKIIEEIKPSPKHKKYVLFNLLLTFYIVIYPLSLGILFFLFLNFFALTDIIIYSLIVLVFIIFLVLAFYLSNSYYNNLRYWITNKRFVIKKGYIGYFFYSVPYERIDDIEVIEVFLLIKTKMNYPRKFFVKRKDIEIGGRINVIGILNPQKIRNKILKLAKSKMSKNII